MFLQILIQTYKVGLLSVKWHLNVCFFDKINIPL
jgi:hypothetical protein